MAMSKLEQRATEDRIMAKEPLTEEEMVVYENLVKNPDDYRPPSVESGLRVCGVCGAEFMDKPATKDLVALSALEQFSDHTTMHNPSPAQWGEAHRRILAGKERAKEST